MADLIINSTSRPLTEAEIYRSNHPHMRSLAYVALVLCSLGLALNAAVVAVMQSDRLRKIPSRIFLAPLAVCDIFVLIFEMSDYIIEYLHGRYTAQVLYGEDNMRCRFGIFFYTYLTSSSSWLLVSFIVERYIWICTPQRRPFVKSSKRSFYVSVGVAICMLAGSFPFLVMTSYSFQRKDCVSDYELFYDIYLEVVFEVLIITLTPSLYIMVCVIRITWTVFIKRPEPTQMSLNVNFGEKKRNHEHDLSKVAVTLSVMFLVGALPKCATNTLYTIIYHAPKIEMDFYQVYWAAAVCKLIFLLNYSLKFLVYMSCSKVFREALWSLCGYSQFDKIVYSGTASLATVSNGHLPNGVAETRI